MNRNICDFCNSSEERKDNVITPSDSLLTQKRLSLNIK